MEIDMKTLRSEVFKCNACALESFGFTRTHSKAPLSKFPPAIGASSPINLLFIGTNPRLSSTNADLFSTIMKSPRAFDQLAEDMWRDRSYLEYGEPGRHYDMHLRIVAGAFNGRPFREVAAVTELFFCATKDSQKLPKMGNPCAERYLHRVLSILRPRVVVTVGAKARDYMALARLTPGTPFAARIGSNTTIVAPVPHPAVWGVRGALADYIDWATKVVRLAMTGNANFPLPPRPSTLSFSQRDLAAWLIYSNPKITGVELTAALYKSFPPPYKVGKRHGPHYLSLFHTGKLLIPDSDPRDW